MPLRGLPSTLEMILSNLIREFGLSSYKICAIPTSTSVILRFANMADSSGQQRRFCKQVNNVNKTFNPRTTRQNLTQNKSDVPKCFSTSVCVENIFPKPNIENKVNDFPKPAIIIKSAGDRSTSVSLDGPNPDLDVSTANETSVAMCTANEQRVPAIENCSAVDETSKIPSASHVDHNRNPDVSTTSESSAAASLFTAEQCVPTIEHSGVDDPREDPTPCDSGRETSNTGACSFDTDTFICDDEYLDEYLDYETQEYVHIGDRASQSDKNVLASDLFVDRERLVKYTARIPSSSMQKIKNTDSNNFFKRLAIDESNSTCAYSILAETDDLIINFDPLKQKILDISLIPGTTPTDNKNLEHFDTLPDYDHLQNPSEMAMFKKATLDLMHFISSQ